MKTPLTKEQALIITGYTGTLCVDFSTFHADVEKRLGRPVFTHEMGNPATMATINEAYRADFMEIMPK